MRRLLFTVLAGISLLLLAATVVLWVRSYWVRDIVSYASDGGNSHIVQSILGRVHILSSLDGGASGGPSYNSDRLVDDALWAGGMSSYPVRVVWHGGHVWQHYQRTHMSILRGGLAGGPFVTNHRLIVIPYWSPAVLFAILPAMWIWRWRVARRRRRIGHCPKCDYDLRATPARCPECGWSHSPAPITSSAVPSLPSGPRE